MRLLPLLLVALTVSPAAAERDFCTGRYRGKTVDLDLKDADIHQVFRLLADVGNVNLVVPEDVKGRVTLRLKRVPWDQVACTVAATHKLHITVDGTILMVTRKGALAAPRARLPADR